MPDGAAIVCTLSAGGLSREEARRLAAECLAAALMPPRRTPHKVVRHIRSWSVADDENRIGLIPPPDLKAHARKTLLSVTAQQFRKYVNATGLTAAAVAGPEVNWVVMTDTKPAPFAEAAARYFLTVSRANPVARAIAR